MGFVKFKQWRGVEEGIFLNILVECFEERNVQAAKGAVIVHGWLVVF